MPAVAAAEAAGSVGSLGQLQPAMEQMDKLLTLALPRGTGGLSEPDPGAVLALACHVVMVQAGFKTALPTGDAAVNKWAPAPHWQREFKNEWKFSYTVPGKRNTLLLHCSLQRASGRMLVHTVEVNNPPNDHLLGLSLPKYVPDDTALRQPSWVGVLQHADALVPMLQQHVIEPLLHGAVDMPPGESEWLTDDGAAGGWQAWWARSTGPGGSYVIPAVLLTGLAVTGVAAFVVMRRRRRVG